MIRRGNKDMIYQALMMISARYWRRPQVSALLRVRLLRIVFAVVSVLVSSTVSWPQAAPEGARLSGLEAQWKAKLNANTVSIVAGGPGETYLDVAHDLAVVLNDDSLRVLPIAGIGGAQNVRDVL